MTRSVLFVFFLLCSMAGGAQVLQQGRVMEYHGEKPKKPLPNVEVVMKGAGKVASDKNGGFTLKFNTLKPGQRVSVIRIDKPGYEVLNREQLESWNVSLEEPLEIVMCLSSEFKRRRDHISAVSNASYAQQQKKEEEALRRDKEEGRLKEDYNHKLEKLRTEYESKLANIEEYADRFARIDLTQLSNTEREILALIEAGDMDAAIARYEQQDYLGKYVTTSNNLRDLEKAEKRISDEKDAQKKARDSVMANIYRQVDAYRLAGGSENYDKIEELLRNMANADTTNMEAVWMYANLCNENDRLGEALMHFTCCLNNTDNPVLQAYFMRMIGSCYDRYGLANEDKMALTFAERLMLKAVKILLPLQNNDTHDITMQLLQAYNNLGWVYQYMGRYDDAERYARLCMDMGKQLVDEAPDGVWNPGLWDARVPYRYQLAWCYFQLGSTYRATQRYEESAELLTLAIEHMEKMVQKDSRRYNENFHRMARRLAEVYAYNLQRPEQATECFKKVIASAELMAKDNPRVYRRSLVGDLRDCTRQYTIMENWPEALKYARATLDVYEQMSKDGLRYNAVDYAEIKRWAGDFCIFMGDAEAAYSYYNDIESYRLSPDARGYLEWNLGHACWMLGRYEESLDAANNATRQFCQLFEDNPEAYRYPISSQLHNSALAYIGMKKNDVAMRAIADGLVVMPDNKELAELRDSLLNEGVDSVKTRLTYASADVIACVAKLDAMRGDMDLLADDMHTLITKWARTDGQGRRSLIADPETEREYLSYLQGGCQPVVPPAVPFTPAQSSEPCDGERYYLFNTASGQFLVGGNGWQTQASIGEGHTFCLQRAQSQVDSNVWGWTISRVPGQYLFAEGDGHAYVDMAGQDEYNPDCNLWNIARQQNGTYRIQLMPTCSKLQFRNHESGVLEPTEYGYDKDQWLGWTAFGTNQQTGEETDTEVSPRVTTTEDKSSYGVEWLFLTREQFRAQMDDYAKAFRQDDYQKASHIYQCKKELRQLTARLTPQQRDSLLKALKHHK